MCKRLGERRTFRQLDRKARPLQPDRDILPARKDRFELLLRVLVRGGTGGAFDCFREREPGAQVVGRDLDSPPQVGDALLQLAGRSGQQSLQQRDVGVVRCEGPRAIERIDGRLESAAAHTRQTKVRPARGLRGDELRRPHELACRVVEQPDVEGGQTAVEAAGRLPVCCGIASRKRAGRLPNQVGDDTQHHESQDDHQTDANRPGRTNGFQGFVQFRRILPERAPVQSPLRQLRQKLSRPDNCINRPVRMAPPAYEFLSGLSHAPPNVLLTRITSLALKRL